MVCLVAVDRYTRPQVLVQFGEAKRVTNTIGLFKESEYTLDFTIHFDQRQIDGIVGSKFGLNSLFQCDVDSANFEKLSGRKIYLTNREHQIWWLPATQAKSQITECFDECLIFPNADEWMQKLSDIDTDSVHKNREPFELNLGD